MPYIISDEAFQILKSEANYEPILGPIVRSATKLEVPSTSYEVPSEDGWYWMRYSEKYRWEPIELVNGCTRLWLHADDRDYPPPPNAQYIKLDPPKDPA